MKTIVEIFKKRKILFKELTLLNLKEYGIRKRYEVYEGVDVKNRYFLIFCVQRKSRFISKNAKELLEVFKKILENKNHTYKFIYVLFFSPYCSKSENILKERGLKIVDASL